MPVRLMVALLSALVILLSPGARADDLDRPKINSGETWTYRSTTEKGAGWHQENNQLTVDHAGSSSIAYDLKTVDSDVAPREVMSASDWSRIRDVNGRQSVVSQPLSFPLKVGKSWTIIVSMDNPNRVYSNLAVKKTYTVVGWQDITVLAGTFHALEIEANGEWKAEIAPRTVSSVGTQVDGQGTSVAGGKTKIAAHPVSGRLYSAYWYVPAVKRWVKSVEEVYGSNDIRTEKTTDELESYKVMP